MCSCIDLHTATPICMQIYTHLHVFMYRSTHTYMHRSTHSYAYSCADLHTPTHIHAQIYTQLHIFMYRSTHSDTYSCTELYTTTCIHVQSYTQLYIVTYRITHSCTYSCAELHTAAHIHAQSCTELHTFTYWSIHSYTCSYLQSIKCCTTLDLSTTKLYLDLNIFNCKYLIELGWFVHPSWGAGVRGQHAEVSLSIYNVDPGTGTQLLRHGSNSFASWSTLPVGPRLLTEGPLTFDWQARD